MNLLKSLRSFMNAPSGNDSDLKSIIIMVRKLCLLMIPYCIIIACVMSYYEGTAWTGYLFGSAYAIYILIQSRKRSIRPYFIRTVILFLSISLISLLGDGWNIGFQFPLFIAVLMILLNPEYNANTKYATCIVFVLIVNGINLFFRNEPIAHSSHILLINELFMLFFTCSIGLTVATTSQKTEHDLVVYNQKLQGLAETDPLTGLSNRRSMEQILKHIEEDEIDQLVTIALGDIDFFKKINDTYGHDAGDYVLKELSKLLVTIPTYSSRWGGEEFLLLFLGLNGDDVFLKLNHFQAVLAKHPFEFNGNKLKVTMTFGISEYANSESFEEIIKQADEKMYMGKKKGRNQVIF